jgi:hypothetical protein
MSLRAAHDIKFIESSSKFGIKQPSKQKHTFDFLGSYPSFYKQEMEGMGGKGEAK